MDVKHIINLLFQSKALIKKGRKFIFAALLLPLLTKAQIANYVGNGGFEDMYSCSAYPSQTKYWNGVDSINGGFPPIISVCYGAVPYDGPYRFQYPRHGNNYALLGPYCVPPTCSPEVNRSYHRNRLKAKLQAGKAYCVKFYINIANTSPYGIDGFGAYFGDNSIDTISKNTVPLTFLTPQVQNPTGNVVTDTLNWTLVTGTFIANGTEKFMLLGNFKSDAATNTVVIVPSASAAVACDVSIDDVSCIPLDLPAYAAAGSDIWAIPGNTLYLGRPQDVGIDEACTWYKLPNTTSVIATAAGFSLTAAASTETYMVKQDICGVIKYDTVVIHPSGVGLLSQEPLSQNLKIYPNPANDILNVEQITDYKLQIDNCELQIFSSLGELIKEEEITLTDNKAQINTKELPEGFYILSLRTKDNLILRKNFVIVR